MSDEFDDELQCERCDGNYFLRANKEPSRYCDDCAHLIAESKSATDWRVHDPKNGLWFEVVSDSLLLSYQLATEHSARNLACYLNTRGVA